MAAGRGAYFGPSLFDDTDHFADMDLVSNIITRDMARTHYPVEELLPDLIKPEDISESAGQRTAGTPRASRAGRGYLAEGFSDDVLFNQIYVEIVDLTTSPNTHYGQSYDAEFITEEVSLVVLIWNSYLVLSKDFTAVSVTNPDGTSLTYPTLPQTIPPGGELQCPLTLEQVGPALQDTTYKFTTGGEEDEIQITGIRVLAMVPEPNWRNGIRHTYSYHTAMYQTERFREQRRSMVDLPIHSQSQDYLMIDAEAQQFFHRLSYGHDKIFGVPIYNELMIPTSTGLPQGDVTITLSATTDPDDMWNLNNGVEFIALIDHANNMAEIKEISSISSPNIVCTQNIVQDFDEKSTRVYPVFFGLVKAATLEQQSDGIDTVKMDFMEFDNG